MQVEDERKDGFFKRLKDNPAVKKLRSIKNIQIVALIFIIAVGLIIYSSVMTSKSASGDKDVAARTSDEARLASMLGNIDGAGKVDVMITSRADEIVGVLIIASGADSITVRIRLIDAASTALGVDRRIVNVFGRS